MIEKIALIADEEIEKTAQEAVREALAIVGSELIYEQSLRTDWQKEAGRLEMLNGKLQSEAERIKKGSGFWKTAFFIEGGILLGVIAGFAAFNLVR